MLNLTDCVSYLWRLQLKNVYLDDKWVDLLPQIQNYEKIFSTGLNVIHIMMCFANIGII